MYCESVGVQVGYKRTRSRENEPTTDPYLGITCLTRGRLAGTNPSPEDSHRNLVTLNIIIGFGVRSERGLLPMPRLPSVPRGGGNGTERSND